jgi:hypothetical protein
MPYVESFFEPMSGSLSVSDKQVDEFERFIDELESLDSGVSAGTQIRGERAIEFCSGWGRLRIYLIRDRFDGVDLLDWDLNYLRMGKNIITRLEKKAITNAFIKNQPQTLFLR